jgi:uncharacterized repeat protein (TIGR03803 family)
MRSKSQPIRFVTAFTLIFGFLTLATPMLAGSTEKVLYSFSGVDGAKPYASLIFDAAGNLYGTASEGGSNNSGCNGGSCGIVFELKRGTNGKWTEKVLHAFSGGNDGGNPYGNLIFDTAGNLYGTTELGGAQASGTVFQLTLGANGTWTETVLYSLCSTPNCKDGGNPTAGLIFDLPGNLYGTTSEGGGAGSVGTVFELSPGSGGTWTETVLHSFCYLNCDGGWGPYASLILDANGNLYGTTCCGGPPGGTGFGVVFKLAPGRGGIWTESVLHVFGNGAGGVSPQASLIFDATGNLYSTTYGGSGNALGTVFKLTHGTGNWTAKVLHSFDRTRDGHDPYAGLIIDAAGHFYGTTPWGGAYGSGGTVFEVTSGAGGGEKLLHSFGKGNDGAYPFASLILDKAGNLYGTTPNGGNHGYGTVFEITP